MVLERLSVLTDEVSDKFTEALDWAVAHGFKNVMLGASFSTGCSIFHCIEEELQVPYRFRKSFPGVVEMDGGRREFVFTMYVRDLEYTVDLQRAAPLLEQAPFVRSAVYNYGRIVVFPLADAYELVKSELKKDPWMLIANLHAVKSNGA